MEVSLFPLSEYWWFYAAFSGFVLLLLVLDLGIFHRQAHKVSFKEAAVWSVIWVTLSLAFNYGLYKYALWKFPSDPRLTSIPGFDPEAAAQRVGLEFLAGYIVEKSLSIDNIFVFVVVFSYFAIPALYQHRILFYGIIGALVFRAFFIGIGSALIQYHWVILVFGGFLILTGLRMMFGPEKPFEPDRNPLIRIVRKLIPITRERHGQKFFVVIDKILHATPLFITLLVVEMTDVIFAIDSVPAIFALTSEPMIVFTSNIFAILGLRSLYFMLADAVDKFHLLKYGLALVLIFVGLKMVWLNGIYDGKFPISISLGIISTIIAASVALSLIFPKRHTEATTTEKIDHSPLDAK